MYCFICEIALCLFMPASTGDDSISDDDGDDDDDDNDDENDADDNQESSEASFADSSSSKSSSSSSSSAAVVAPSARKQSARIRSHLSSARALLPEESDAHQRDRAELDEYDQIQCRFILDEIQSPP